MNGARTRSLGKLLRVIVRITKEQLGMNGGHLLVCHLECGHTVTHLSGSHFKVGRRTGCPECR